MSNNTIEKAHIFFSIDLVDSTKLKANSEIEPSSVYSIFWKADDGLANEVCKIQYQDEQALEVWKSIGDEVVFRTKKAISIEIDIVDNKVKLGEGEYLKLFTILKESSKVIDNFNEKDQIEKIKGAIWLVPFYIVDITGEIPHHVEKDKKFDISTMANNVETIISCQRVELSEYFGTAMDHGFRIASNSMEGNFIVSGLIIHALSNCKIDEIVFDKVEEIIINAKLKNATLDEDLTFSPPSIYRIRIEKAHKEFLYIKNIGHAPLKGFNKLFSIYTLAYDKAGFKNFLRLFLPKNKYNLDSVKVKNIVTKNCTQSEFSFDELMLGSVLNHSPTERDFFKIN